MYVATGKCEGRGEFRGIVPDRNVEMKKMSITLTVYWKFFQRCILQAGFHLIRTGCKTEQTHSQACTEYETLFHNSVELLNGNLSSSSIC